MMLALCLCIGAAVPTAVPVFADAAGLLDLKLSTSEVKQGESLSFTGIATMNAVPVESLSVTITVLDSKQEPVKVFDQITTAKGDFSGALILPQNDITGTYSVKAVASMKGSLVVKTENFTVKESHHQSVLTTNQSEYRIGSDIRVSGKAMLGTQPLGNQEIPLKLMFRGEPIFVTQARTATNGEFSSIFKLNVKEAGSYQVIAAIPGGNGVQAVELTKGITIVDNPIISTLTLE